MKIISKKDAISLGLKRYFTGKPCKRGHISERNTSKSTCLECKRLHYRKNKEYYSKKAKEYYLENKELISIKNKRNQARKDYQREYIEKNRESLLDKRRKYTEKNREKVRRQRRKYRKNSLVSEFVRNSLNRIFSDWKGGREEAEKVSGYTFEDLKSHIESKFQPGMSWDNRGEWHIDHIKPISLFIKEGVKDPSVINALSNLQPLWAKENQSKGCKY